VGDVLLRKGDNFHLLDADPLRGAGLQHVSDHPCDVDRPCGVALRHAELLKNCDGKALGEVLMVYGGVYRPFERGSRLTQASSLMVAHLPTLAFSWAQQKQASLHSFRALRQLLEPREQMLEEVRHPQCHQG
jgi:hypothetical protein